MKQFIVALRPIFTLIMLLSASSQAADKQQFSGINKLTFNNDKYSKNFVGNGFLIQHNHQLYAVTVKHALLEAQTPEMKTVSIKDHINSWQVHPNKQPEQTIVLGELINEDLAEAIDMKVLSKDWLVFQVKENNSPLIPLTLRNTPVEKGETLTAYGCSYANKETCVQDEYKGTFVSADHNNLRINMPELDLSKLRGLSGSPVLDNNNQVVGIVSNVLKSTSGEGFDFAPATLNYLISTLNAI